MVEKKDPAVNNINKGEVLMMGLPKSFYEAKRMEKSTQEEVERLQKMRLLNLLEHVLMNSHFYRKYYKQHGITLDNFKSVKVTDLPFTDKSMIMGNFDELICDKRLKITEIEKFVNDPNNCSKKFEQYRIVHTSGTTGESGLFIYSDEEWNKLRGLLISRVSKLNVNPFNRKRICMIGATGGNFAGISVAADLPRLLFDFIPISINSPIEQIIEKVDSFNPEMITGYASGISLIAQLQLEKKISISPEDITASGEILTPSMREDIIKAFNVNPTNFYATSESICLGCDCMYYNGIHLFSDYHIFETVDEDLKPTQAGVPGKLVLTCLYKYIQPLIRYQMNDELSFEHGGCKCNSPFPRITNFIGRQDLSLRFESVGGKKDFIHGSQIDVFHIPGLKKFQFIQTARDEVLLKAVFENENDKHMEQLKLKILQILKEKNLDTFVKTKIEIVDEIKVDSKTGKFRPIIPYKY